MKLYEDDAHFRCPDCKWVGTIDEMGADYTLDGEAYCNYVCPKCGTWHHSPEDYEPVNEA